MSHKYELHFKSGYVLTVNEVGSGPAEFADIFIKARKEKDTLRIKDALIFDPNEIEWYAYKGEM